MAESKKALTRDALALIVEGERFLLDTNITCDPETALRLQEKLEKLRELLAKEPDDRASIRREMDGLREVCNIPRFGDRESAG